MPDCNTLKLVKVSAKSVLTLQLEITPDMYSYVSLPRIRQSVPKFVIFKEYFKHQKVRTKGVISNGFQSLVLYYL